MNKKTLTITFHNANNYGAVLQAYALQKCIKKKYSNEILDFNNFNITNSYRFFRRGTNNIFKIIYSFLKMVLHLKKEIIRIKNFNLFRKNMSFTKKYDTIDKVLNEKFDYDVLITGSDQVWNDGITGKNNDIYYLNFGNKSSKRIAYAASCGNVEKIKNNKNIILEEIKNIDYISVRENELYNYLKTNNIKSVTKVVDPTLLLKKEEWLALNISSRIIKEKYIFVYSVGNENELFIKTINYLAKKTQYIVVHFDKKKNKKLKCKTKNLYHAGPFEFLSLLYNSEMIVTTSFHGFALGTIFNKKMFIILTSYKERLTTLAQEVGLENLIVKKLNNIEKVIKNNENINWNDINTKLEIERNKSENWLINSIRERKKLNDKK